MNDHLQETSGAPAGPSKTRIAIIVGVLAVILLPTYLKHRERVAADGLLQKLKSEERSAAELSEIENAEAERTIEERHVAEAAAVSKALALSALEDSQATADHIDELAKAAVAWNATLGAIMDSESGNAIAASPASTERAAEIIQRPKTLAVSDSTRLARKLEVLSNPIKEAAKEPVPGYRVSEVVEDEISKIASEAKRSTLVYRESETELRALAEISSANAISDSTLTLAQAINGISQRKQSEAVSAEEQRMAVVQAGLDAELKRVKDDNAKQIAAAKALAEKEIAAVEQRRIEKMAEIERQEKEEDIIRETTAASKAKLEAEFQRALPEIKTYLDAFLKPGVKIRRPNASAAPGPASFSALAGYGATADTQTGIEQLIKQMNPAMNDRSDHAWAGSVDYWHKENWHRVDVAFPRKAHELLRKWGPTLVEKKMLEP